MGFLNPEQAKARMDAANQKPSEKKGGFLSRLIRRAPTTVEAFALGIGGGGLVNTQIVNMAENPSGLGGDPIKAPEAQPWGINQKFAKDNPVMGPEAPVGPTTNDRLVPTEAGPSAPEDDVEKGILAVVTNGGDPGTTVVNVRSGPTTQMLVVEKLPVGTIIILGVKADGSIDGKNGFARIIARYLPDGTVKKYPVDPAKPESGAFMYSGYVKESTASGSKVGLRTSGEQVIVTPEVAVASNPGGADLPVVNPVEPGVPNPNAAPEPENQKTITDKMHAHPELVNATLDVRNLGVEGYKTTYYVAVDAEGKTIGVYVPADQTENGLGFWRTKNTEVKPVGNWMEDKTNVNLSNIPWQLLEGLVVQKNRCPAFQLGKKPIVVEYPDDEEYEQRVSSRSTSPVNGYQMLPGTAAQAYLDSEVLPLLDQNKGPVKAVTEEGKNVTVTEVNGILIKVIDLSKLDAYLASHGLSRMKASPAFDAAQGGAVQRLRVYDETTGVLTIYEFRSADLDPYGVTNSAAILGDILWGVSGKNTLYQVLLAKIKKTGISLPKEINQKTKNAVLMLVIADSENKGLQELLGMTVFN
jgi:hypothetical protein